MRKLGWRLHALCFRSCSGIRALTYLCVGLQSRLSKLVEPSDVKTAFALMEFALHHETTSLGSGASKRRKRNKEAAAGDGDGNGDDGDGDGDDGTDGAKDAPAARDPSPGMRKGGVEPLSAH